MTSFLVGNGLLKGILSLVIKTEWNLRKSIKQCCYTYRSTAEKYGHAHGGKSQQ